MMHHLWIGILFGLLLPCQSFAKLSKKECLQLAFQDSQKIENAIKGCFKQDEAEGRKDLLEILKDDVERLTNEYEADVEKASRDLYDVSSDEMDMGGIDSRDQNEVPSDERDTGELDSRDQVYVSDDEKDMRQLDAPDSMSKDPFWRGRPSYSRHRRIKRPGKPIINRCSVPDNVRLPVSFKKTFTPSCRKYYSCYNMNLYPRILCDKTFRDDMGRSCRRSKVIFACMHFEGIYYNAVKAGGKS